MALYEVVLNGTNDGQPYKTVMHYVCDGTADKAAFVDAWGTFAEMHLAPLCVESLIFQNMTIRDVVAGAIGADFEFLGGPFPGSNADPKYASLLAANVRKISSATTRPNKGRIYQGGIPSAALNGDGYLTTSHQQALNDAWEYLREVSPSQGDPWYMVIKATDATRPNTVAYNLVESFSTKGALSTQKRRNWAT
jgi:hypothetical protein